MAHSYVMSFDDEADAFRAYARGFPGNATVFLIDTYDTVEGAHGRWRWPRSWRPRGSRSPASASTPATWTSLAKRGAVLDAGGLDEVEILASGDLDEYRIAELIAAGAAIDAFGVGTQMGTSGDALLGAVYKLVEDGQAQDEAATGKVTLPGRKQVWRYADRDVIGLHDEGAEGRPLLRRAMAGGRARRARRRWPDDVRERLAALAACRRASVAGAGRRAVVAGRHLARAGRAGRPGALALERTSGPTPATAGA